MDEDVKPLEFVAPYTTSEIEEENGLPARTEWNALNHKHNAAAAAAAGVHHPEFTSELSQPQIPFMMCSVPLWSLDGTFPHRQTGVTPPILIPPAV